MGGRLGSPLVFLFVVCSAAVGSARCLQLGRRDACLHEPARQLLEVGARCPVGCAADACMLDSTSGGYRCIRCQNKLVVRDDGTCGCPAGRYAASENDCADCPKGSWCAGGTYTAVGTPAKTDCALASSSLTTIGRRSASIKACVNLPGTYYSVTEGIPSASSCPANTYGPGLRKQRACVPCPPGYTTNTVERSTSSSACLVPEGYYLKGPGQVAPCPKGEYKSGFLAAASCTKCANGVSTVSEASTSEAACVVVLPTFYPVDITAGIVKAARTCPQKFYCPGGDNPTAAFDPSATPLVLDGTTVQQCPWGTWTQELGSMSADQCMTPPGHYTNTVSGRTLPCANGEYRAEWKPAVAAASCSKCGDNILSTAEEQIVEYAITADATATLVAVRESAGACYIKPGQGMYYSSASNTFRAVNCDSNSYGVTNLTYGLAAFPCRDCSAGMQTSTALPLSAAHYALDQSLGGFTSPMACVTKAGYGYNGRVATKCPAGSYNAAGNYSPCTKCTYGLSTLNDANSQVDISNCTLAAGFGFHNGAIVPCPIGTYNSQLRNDTSTPCTACPESLTTSDAGGTSLASCNLCAAGWGGPGYGTTCNIRCGGSNGANFGPAGREAGDACFDCPAQTLGFSFDYLAVNQPFAPAVVSRLGATSPAECLSEFAQISDTAWYLPASSGMVSVPEATNFSACINACKADADCQLVSFDYDALVDADKCSYKKVAVNGSAVVGFKAMVGGDMGGSSVANRTKSHSLASGSYTFWLDDPSAYSYVETVSNVATMQQCLNACDQSGGCAGVVLTDMTSPSSTPSACKHLFGDSSVATFKRSMTRAVVERLRLEDVLTA